MKRYLPFLLACFFIVNSNAQSTRWARDIGSSTDIETAQKICTDGVNTYVGGYYRTDLVLCDTLPTVLQYAMPQMTCNLVISKFDSSGNCVWTLPGISISHFPPYVQGICAIRYDGMGHLYVAGSFTDTMIFDTVVLDNSTCTHGYCVIPFVLKLDTSGTILWSKTFTGTEPTTGPSVNDLIVANGDIYVTGDFSDSLVVDGVSLSSPYYGFHSYILKIKPSGATVWAKSIGNSGRNSHSDAIISDGKDLYTLGNFFDSLSFPSGAIRTAGTSSFLAKYDTSGDFIWVYGDSSRLKNYLSYASLRYDNAGSVYVDGNFFGTLKVDTAIMSGTTSRNCVAKFDTSGVCDWAFSESFKTGNQGGTVVCPDKNGFYLYATFKDTALIGSSTYVSNGLGDILLVRYDSNRNVVWSKTFGGTSEENPTDIINNVGTVYLTGFTYSNYSIDTHPIVNAGYMDMLIVKMYDSSVHDALVTLNTKEINAAGTSCVFPNPTTGVLNITVAEHGDARAMLYSLTGQVAAEKMLSGRENAMDISALAPGVYLLKITGKESTTVFRVIKN